MTLRPPVTATSYAVSEIRRLIVEGELEPGSRIDQDELAQNMGLSRLPVRQALAHLAERKFVELRERRGAVVAPISVTDMRQLYEFRNLMEQSWLARNFDNLRQSKLGELERNCEKTDKATEEKNLARFMVFNAKFHFTLFNVVPNKYTRKVLIDHYELSERYHWGCLSNNENLQQSLKDHIEIVAAIRSGNREEFLGRLSAHNDKTVMWVERTMPARAE